jgi:acid phosphatase (class A)
MKKRILSSVLVAASLGVGAAALGQSATPALKGYLSDPPQALRLLPPPPATGSARQAGDEAAFKATRTLQDSPRWTLATADADMSQGASLFACAIGQKLAAGETPTLFLLLRRVALDDRAVVDPPKDYYARPRPYLASDAPICVPKDPALAKSGSYPSGHSTLSWTWGLILAELAPDRATDILMRARAIGESRVVCGVHYPSDIEAGRTTGAVLVAALHADAAFRADMDKARAELAAARSKPHVGAEDCLATDQASAHPPY